MDLDLDLDPIHPSLTLTMHVVEESNKSVRAVPTDQIDFWQNPGIACYLLQLLQKHRNAVGWILAHVFAERVVIWRHLNSEQLKVQWWEACVMISSRVSCSELWRILADCAFGHCRGIVVKLNTVQWVLFLAATTSTMVSMQSLVNRKTKYSARGRHIIHCLEMGLFWKAPEPLNKWAFLAP